MAMYLSLAAGIMVTKIGPRGLQRLVPIVSLAQFPLVIGILLLLVFSGGIYWGSALGLPIVLSLNPGASYASAWANGMHPQMINKYGAAKRLFGIVFPFEKYLENTGRSRNNAKYVVAGNRAIAITQVFLLLLATIKWSLVSSP